MSYLVIARKWRPQTFEEVIGQPHVTRTLQNAIRSQRIAHAYLFTGARGVGKTSVARILAKTLNCRSETTPPPCNVCSNCREITQGNSMDVLEIDGASNRGIDSIRELRETVRYRPAKSIHKIYIIDEVHMLTTEAFNALLKTLEEPPEHVIFIFATTEPHKIPSTILSRCQRFDFRRIATEQLVRHLKDIALQEKAQISDLVLYAIAREADGSMRDAQSLLEQLLAFSGDGLSDEEVLDILGVVDRRSVHRVGEAILSGDAGACLEVVGDLYRRGIDSRRFCQQMCDYFRNLLFFSLGNAGGASPMDLPREEIELLERLAEKTTPESLYLYFQMIMKAEEEIRRSSLPKISLEMLLLRLAQLPHLETLEGVLEKVTLLEKRLQGDSGILLSEKDPVIRSLRAPKPIPPQVKQDAPAEATPDHPISSLSVVTREAEESAPLKSPEPVDPGPGADVPASPPEVQGDVREDHSKPPPPAAPVTASDAANRWPDFLQWLKGKDPILAAKLTQSRISQCSETVLEVEVLEIYENAFSEPQSIVRLADEAAAYFGRSFQWTVRSRSSLRPDPRDLQKSRQSGANPKRSVMRHPAVLQALDVLGGELVEIRPLKKGQNEEGKRGVSTAREDGSEPL